MQISLSNQQMRAADQYTIQTLGVPSLALMERAGAAVAQEAKNILKSLKLNEVLIVCGGGNNGGDGFCCARLLQEQGVEVAVLCLAKSFSPDCAAVKAQYKGGVFNRMPRRRYPFIIDCIFGTGLNRTVEGDERALIEFINTSAAYVLSVDIPSGLNGDNGLKMGVCVQADKTLAIGEYKHGLFLNDGTDVCGKLVKVDIGIDACAVEKDAAIILEDADIAEFFPKRRRNTHKGVYGKVDLIAGSKDYVGAALMATMSALKGGAGYTRLCVPQGLFPIFSGKIPEAILTCFQGETAFSYCEFDMQKLLKSQCIAFGMGVGVSLEIYKMICYLLNEYTGNLLLDADALNALAKYGLQPLKNKKCAVLLTPHIQEFSRLSGYSVQEIQQNGVKLVQNFAEEYNVTVLLKSAVSLIYGKGKTYLNLRGSAALAKGGSGDVLSGFIASICAQGHTLTQSAVCGAYVMGVAGELCEQALGQYSVTATDVIQRLPNAILRITENSHDYRR
ncbi:MAG: NAD(P)H-hydrate dehydratase [Clostridia bacterium]|nr:NAD(P)H-hydrate dehydratase [Clostridia bacterium]